MAITRVSEVSAGLNSGTANPLTTPTFNAVSGNLIVVGVLTGSNTVSSVTDTAGNTYSLAASQARGDAGAKLWVYYAKNITANASNAVSANLSAGQNFNWIEAIQYSGLDTTSPLDATGSGGATAGTTNMASSAFSTAVSGELVVLWAAQAASGVTYTAGTDFTIVNGTLGDSHYGGSEEYITSTQLSSYTAHITSTSANASGMVAWASFKPTVTGATSGSSLASSYSGAAFLHMKGIR